MADMGKRTTAALFGGCSTQSVMISERRRGRAWPAGHRKRGFAEAVVVGVAAVFVVVVGAWEVLVGDNGRLGQSKKGVVQCCNAAMLQNAECPPRAAGCTSAFLGKARLPVIGEWPQGRCLRAAVSVSRLVQQAEGGREARFYCNSRL